MFANPLAINAAPAIRLIGVTPITVPHSMTCAFRRTCASADRKLLEINDANPRVIAPRKHPRNRDPLPDQPREAAAGNPVWVLRTHVNWVVPGQRVSRYNGSVPPANKHRNPMGTVMIIAAANKTYFNQGTFRSTGDGAGKTAKK